MPTPAPAAGSEAHHGTIGALLLALTLCACASSGQERLSPVADHHAHIRSDIGGEVLPRVQRIRWEKTRDLSRGRQDGDELIAMLDRHGIRYAAVLSLGYMYAIPELDFDDEYAKVRHENDFVAEQARHHPDRLVAFCGISPIAAYALEEIDRCATMRVTGIKMHMANSDVDLRDEDQIRAVAEVFRRANELGLAIVIHLRPRGHGYGAGIVDTFLTRILPNAPDVPVQLAHLGAGGGTDRATLRAVERFAESLEAHDNLWFDVSAAFFRPHDVASDWVGRSTLRQNRWAAARIIKTLGPERILFGSDWDSMRFEQTLRPLRRLRYLDESDLRTIFNNKAPYFPD
jgi:uncharacterized protein